MKNQSKNSLFIAIACLCVLGTTQAQTVADALRYSIQDPTGTARFAGAAGAFTALGADYGAITVNPAGAAMYRSSEFVIGTALRFHNTDTELKGSNNVFTERRNNFQLDNLGLVFQKTPRRGKWTTFNTMLGYNRTANYNRKYYYEGDAAGSIINSYYDDAVASGSNPDNFYPFGAGLASDANAIYLDNGVLQSDFQDNRSATINHSQFVSERGGAGELHFGFAGNYNERLMLGITAGVPLINYNLSSTYTESDPTDRVNYFNNLTLNETVRSEGVGFNLKLGAIFRATQALRIGAAIHTPSFISLNDGFNSDLSYGYTDGSGTQQKTATSPDGIFDYKLNTPLRTSVGVAYLFGTQGFLSGDIEILDYSGAIYNLTANGSSSANAQAERALNRSIEQTYTQAVNVKMGGELAQDVFRLRAGMQFLGNPYSNGGENKMVYTAGIGYRGEEGFYLDLAYRNLRGSSTLQPYTSASDPLTAISKATNHDFLLTLGFKF